MKRLAALLLALSSTAFAGVSITFNGQIAPGVYGQVTLGDQQPAPRIYETMPVLIAPPPRGVVIAPPIYIYAPYEHRMDWRRYCYRYNACGRPVYFVHDEWVRERHERRDGPHDRDWVPPGHRREHGRGHD